MMKIKRWFSGCRTTKKNEAFFSYVLAEIGVCIDKNTVKFLFLLFCKTMIDLVNEIRPFNCFFSSNHTKRHQKDIELFKILYMPLWNPWWHKGYTSFVKTS